MVRNGSPSGRNRTGREKPKADQTDAMGSRRRPPPLGLQAERTSHSFMLKSCLLRSQHLNGTHPKDHCELIKWEGRLHSHHRAASTRGHPSLGDT